MSLGVVAIILFSGAALLGAAGLHGFLYERHEVYRTLRTVRRLDQVPGHLRRQELAPTLLQRVVLPGLQQLAALSARLTPLSSLQRLSKQLEYAGSPPEWDAERVLSTKLVLAAAAGIGALTLTSLSDVSMGRRIFFTCLVAAIGYYAPDSLLRSRAQRRQDAMLAALPDTLDLLSVTVEAGLGFDAAIVRVAQQSEGPLAEELNRMLREMQLGKPRSQALRDLADRTSLTELKSFVLALVQADVFGVSIARVLQVQAQEMRIKRRQRAEEQAQKVPVKMAFPLVVCILPALFVVLLGPAAINIYRTIIAG